jgi:sialate O-acetylesterase
VVLAAAKPFVHPLFASNMVLQRDTENPVWGWTTPGATVSVTMNAVTYQAMAGADGRWQVLLGSLTAGGPYTIVISGPQSQTIGNVMMGDVYLCSGQSNMAGTLKVINVINLTQEVADSVNYPKIRQFSVPTLSENSPQEVPAAGGSWVVPTASTTGTTFSATAYFMAREIYKQRQVPIGIICSALSGSDIKSWTEPTFAAAFADTAQAAFDQTGLAATTTSVSGLYNGMLAPLAPFKIKAAVWYQGEQNASASDPYGRLLPAFMGAVRNLFANQNLPVIVIQLPNYGTAQTQPVESSSGWAGIREAQLQSVLADPHAAIVTNIDLGEAANIHPRDKQDVGLRAANVAAELVYGQTGSPTNAVGQGPIFESAVITGGGVRCTFKNVGAGLMVGRKPLDASSLPVPLSAIQQLTGVAPTGFAICGADGVYYAANATIEVAGNSVLISSPGVPSPVAVRYLWANNPSCNLYRKVIDGSGNVIDGIPAAPFRTDPAYKLSVNSGSGSGTYLLNATAGVTANPITGQVFDHWSGDTGFLALGNSTTTTATVGQRYVSILATYRVTSAPSGLAAVPEIGKVTLNWTAMASVHYNIKRGASAAGPFTTIAGNLTNVTQYVDATVSGGTTYYYVLSAVNLQGEGPNSAAVSATMVPVVENVTVSDSSGKVALAWAAFNGTADHFNIKRATSAGGPFTTIATVSGSSTSYTDRSVLSGDTFYYVVTAVNASGGETVNSLSVHAVLSFLPPPLADADVGTVGFRGGASADSSGSCTVVGSGSDIGGTADSFHFVYARLSGNGTITARVVSVGSGTPKIGVLMRASLDPGAASAAVVTNSTQTRCELRTASDGTTSISNSNAGVNATTNPWVRIVRTGSTFAGYVSPDGTTWTSVYFNPPAIPMTDPIYVGLAVSACDNAATTTAVFDNVTITGVTLAVPPAPSGLTVSQTVGAAQATLRWPSATAACAYNVKRAATSGGPYVTVASGLAALSHECTALSAGTTYYYCITAVDSAGESANSNEVIVDLTPPVITAPASISVNATGTSGAVVTFGTSALDDTGGTLVTNASPASGAVFPLGATTVTTTAADALGNTASLTFTVTVTVPAPTALAGTALSESQIRLTWTDNASFATGYVLQRSPHGQAVWTTLGGPSSAATTYDDSSLGASSSYDYRLQRTVSGYASDYATLTVSTPSGAGDGIPGYWRLQYFGNGLSAAGAAAPNADPDGDGLSNLNEYLAGTSPVDAASTFKITAFNLNGANAVLTFPSVLGKQYRLERATDLGAPTAWSALQQHIAGTGGTVTVTQADDGSLPRRFYRIVVE